MACDQWCSPTQPARRVRQTAPAWCRLPALVSAAQTRLTLAVIPLKVPLVEQKSEIPPSRPPTLQRTPGCAARGTAYGAAQRAA